MSTARPVYKGASWRISMRCVGRQFMLTPSPAVKAVVGYCLAVTCERYGILLHSFHIMTDHVHLDTTDPQQAVSDFRRDFKSLVARALNCHYQRSEYLWAPDDGMVQVETEDAAAGGMAYTVTNAVAAELVASPKAYPGLCTTCEDLGVDEEGCSQWLVHRPKFFFSQREDSKLPKTAILKLTPHPLAKDPAKFLADVKRRVKKIVEKKRAEVAKRGDRFAGAAAILAHNWWDTPKTPEKRRKLNPRFAEPDPKRRVQMLERYKSFQADYAKALKQWRETGKATFPAGTNKMRNYPGVTVRTGIP